MTSSGTAVVVGGASGIGAAICRSLANQPWCDRLVVSDLDESSARHIAAGLDGISARGVGTDVTDPSSIDSLVDGSSEAAYVAIAAGIFSASPSLETPREDFHRTLDVNLIGVFGVAQAYARQMAGGAGGAIVSIASIAATLPRVRQAAYCASKAGVRQALRVLGMEAIEHGVRINTVSPGPTDTPMMRKLAADHPHVDALASGSLESLRPRIPAGRVARPDEIAAAVTFLLSPQAQHIVLRDLVVDGGELLGA